LHFLAGFILEPSGWYSASGNWKV